MKWINPLLVLSFFIMAVSCNKKYTVESTAMPEELSILKGKWKVVSFLHETDFGVDTTNPPWFNRMEFDTKKVTLRFNNELVHKAKFSFVKDEQLPYYILGFTGKKFSGYLNHHVILKSDTLELVDRIYDGGTIYYLVKE